MRHEIITMTTTKKDMEFDLNKKYSEHDWIIIEDLDVEESSEIYNVISDLIDISEQIEQLLQNYAIPVKESEDYIIGIKDYINGNLYRISEPVRCYTEYSNIKHIISIKLKKLFDEFNNVLNPDFGN